MEELVGAEESVKVEEPVGVEELARVEEPVGAEELVAVVVRPEESVKVEEPVRLEELVRVGEAVGLEELVGVVEELVRAEKSVTERVEESARLPAKIRAHGRIDRPPLVEPHGMTTQSRFQCWNKWHVGGSGSKHATKR